jgi:predicted Zn-dependent protease
VVSPELGSVVAGAGQLPAALAIASYSRKQETEADRLGQEYIAAEGWDPEALADSMDALTREQELQGGRDPNRMSFFDSHPTTPDRARESRAYASTLTGATPNRIAFNRAAFVERLDGIVIGASAKAGVFLDDRFVHPNLGFTLTFPKGWPHENAPTVVLSYPKDESAVLALEVAGKGDDPATAADKFGREIPLQERNSGEINGLPAVTGITQVVDRGQQINALITWIAKDGLVYQFLGACRAERWKDHRPKFEAAARSFRTPSAAELQDVYENRLRLVEARRGETVSAVAKRGGGNWSAAKVAAANAMAAGDKLTGGEPIKVSKRERYEP